MPGSESLSSIYTLSSSSPINNEPFFSPSYSSDCFYALRFLMHLKHTYEIAATIKPITINANTIVRPIAPSERSPPEAEPNRADF